MKIQTFVRPWTIVTATLVLAACALPASTRPGLSVEMLFPESGMLFPLGDFSRIRADAFSPGGGVTRMIFYANGIVVGEDSTIETSAPGDFPPMNFYGSVSWRPAAVGEYLVQAEAFRSDGSAFSATSRVCVVDLDEPIVLLYGYTGPCAIPTPNPDAPTGLGVGMAAHAIPASLAYFWMCPASMLDPTIAFEATVDDPSDRVVFVTIEYSVPLRGDPDGRDAISFGLNWTASSASGAKIFSGTTSGLHLLAMLQGEFQGDGGILTWTARAFGRGGEILATDGPYDILASPCVAAVIGLPMLIIEAPSETLAPSPTSTNTATLTPFIPTKTTAPTLKPFVPSDTPDPGGSCKDYKTKDSCTANSCTWDPGIPACY